MKWLYDENNVRDNLPLGLLQEDSSEVVVGQSSSPKNSEYHAAQDDIQNFSDFLLGIDGKILVIILNWE